MCPNWIHNKPKSDAKRDVGKYADRAVGADSFKVTRGVF